MEEVAAEYSEELEEENDTLSAKVKAMEEELEAMKAKAMEDEETAKAKAEEEEARAKAKSGVRPVAKGQAIVTNARAQWTSGISAFVAQGMTKQKAAIAMNRENPGLREQMVQEANA